MNNSQSAESKKTKESQNDTYRQVAKALHEATKILIVSHFNPDADAYGSALGLGMALRDNGKEIVWANESPLNPRYSFIPSAIEITAALPDSKFDRVVVCDCGDLGRVGDQFKLKISTLPGVINIDHHASNSMFGEINLVDRTQSSTSEMIYRLLATMNFSISSEAASALLTGIYGDTGSFRYSSTSAETLEIAAKLVRLGASPVEISRKLFESRSLTEMKIASFILNEAKFLSEGKVAIAVAPQSVYEKFSASLNDTEGLVEELRSVSGVVISAFIRQDLDIWRVSLRSSNPEVDLSLIASSFGGGGHRAAAAFRSRSTLTEIEDKLVPLLNSEVEKL